MSKRPVAFRVPRLCGDMVSHYFVTTSEDEARAMSDTNQVEYEGLYLVGDRHTFNDAQSSQVSTLAKLADKWRVQAKQYDEAAKECYYRGDDDEGDMNDIEGSALFRCATELDTALKSLAAQPPAAPIEAIPLAEPPSALTADDRAQDLAHSRSSAATEDDCPGHVASTNDPRICGRCGIHIDSLRPDTE